MPPTALRLVVPFAVLACARGGAAPPPPGDSAVVVRPAATPGGQVYDLLVVNGTLLDGSGGPGVRGDLAIRGDRIAAMGALPRAEARDTIDASGLVVAPGFIDMLGHSEYALIRDGRAISKLYQGVTSEITGEVNSVVPVNERTRRALSVGEVQNWTDLDGYFTQLARARPAINLGTFVTVGSVRRYVMGDANRPATAAELEQMRQLVAQAMDAGAFGLGAGLAYSPASFASTEEIVELARVAGRYGGGYTSHIRSEGARLVEAVREAIGIGERAGTWVQIHHLKASGRANWGRVRDAIAVIEEARRRGVDVTADMYPYAASGTDLDAVLPSWMQEGGNDSLLWRLRNPATRARLRAELLGDGGVNANIGGSAGGPAGVMIASVHTDSLKRYQGMRLTEFAAARGQPVVDAVLDLILADRASTGAIYFSMSEEDVQTVLRQPWMMVGIDGEARPADEAIVGRPHPRAYGTFPRILCRYVRERSLLTLPEAVRRFTSLPASRVGLEDRGVLRVGAFADITIFDPDTVCDRATFENPVQLSVGVQHVLVNGVPVLRDGALTDARPGRALRR